MSNLSILQNYKKNLYFKYPYPHFHIQECLPEKIYDLLEKDYSLFEKYFQKNDHFHENNIRLQISSNDFFEENLFKNSIWYDFISYHTSLDFLEKITDIFYEDLKIFFPKISFEKKYLNSCGLRNSINNKEKNFVLDCQPGINTKVLNKRSVRQAHIDNPHELIGGLFYLKLFEDKSGGDLEVYEAKKKILFHQKSEVFNNKDIKLFKTIKYQPNNVFFFINSSISIHSVTPRNPTNYLRRLTNIIVERYIDGYNFDIPRNNSFLKKILKNIYK